MTRFIIQGLKIDELPPDGKKYFKNEFNVPVELIDGVPVELKCGTKTPVPLLEITNLDTDIPDDKNNLSILASRIITSFRLWDEGGIGYSQKLNELNTPTTVEDGGLPYRFPENRSQEYKINYNDLIRVEDLAEDIGKVFRTEPKESILRFALSRFNRSYDEINEEDVLLDLVICLEILSSMDTCFLCDKIVEDKKDLISKNLVPFIIADVEPIKTKDKDNEVKGNIGLANTTRNDIVHRGKRIDVARLEKNNIKNVWIFLLDIRRYARKSLRGYIKTLIEKPQLRAIDIKFSLYRDLLEKAIKKIDTEVQKELSK